MNNFQLEPLTLSPRVCKSFKFEQLTELTLPGALVLLEGGIVAVIAAKIYEVSPFTISLITAAPMFANLSSFLWNLVSSGKAKVAFANVLQICSIICLLLVAIAPINEIGVVVLVSSMIVSRVLVSGLITVRSVIWSLNYDRNNRAKATGPRKNGIVTEFDISTKRPLLRTRRGAEADAEALEIVASELVGPVVVALEQETTALDQH